MSEKCSQPAEKEKSLREKILETLTAPLVQVLDKEGITPSYLAKKIKAELEATEDRVFCHRGEVITSEPRIAWDVRQRARQDAHRLLNHYPAEKHEVSGPEGRPIQISAVDPAEIEALREASRVFALALIGSVPVDNRDLSPVDKSNIPNLPIKSKDDS